MGRFVRVALAVAVAWFAAGVASFAPGSPAVSTCAAAGSHHASVLIQHGDGSIVARCVAFDTPTITGEALLDQTGVAWSGQVFGGFGSAVCAMDGEPVRYSVCPGKDYYWAVFVSRGGGAWQLSAVGVSSLTLANGDAAGFRYNPAAGTAAVPASPAGVCAAPAATPSRAAASGVGATARATARASAGATPPGTAGAADSGLPAGTAPAPSESGAIAVATAGATAASATPEAAAALAGGRPSEPGDSPDLGLLLAAIAGGGLGGLLLLRLLTARSRAR